MKANCPVLDVSKLPWVWTEQSVACAFILFYTCQFTRKENIYWAAVFPYLKSQLRNFVWRGFCLRGFCSGGDSPFYVTTRDDASDVLLRHNPKVALVSVIVTYPCVWTENAYWVCVYVFVCAYVTCVCTWVDVYRALTS